MIFIKTDEGALLPVDGINSIDFSESIPKTGEDVVFKIHALSGENRYTITHTEVVDREIIWMVCRFLRSHKDLLNIYAGSK